jgi:hypothetical protein
MGHQVRAHDGDVVMFLKSQHKQIEALFREVVATLGTDRQEKFLELCRLLSRHEAAEEVVVHPVARGVLKGGEAMVAARLREETEAKRAIAELKVLDPSSDAFDTKIRELQSSVLADAGCEEREELDRLTESVDAARLMRMRSAVEMAESRAGGAEDTDPGVYDRVTAVGPGDSATGRP